MWAPMTGERSDRDPTDVAEILCGERPAACVRLSGSGNSGLYRVELNAGPFALKLYPSLMNDPRPRLRHEVVALLFLSENQQAGVLTPRPITCNEELGALLMSWQPGRPALPEIKGDLERLRAIIQRFRTLSRVAMAKSLPEAIGASLSARELGDELDRRRRVLWTEGLRDPRLLKFLEFRLDPALTRALKFCEDRYSELDLDTGRRLTRREAVLSPSDFGLHNALRLESGALALVDLEYFGWDDPVRFVVDAALHPAAGRAPNDWRRALRILGEPFLKDAGFQDRLVALAPLIAGRWALIVLNEFLPAVWRRRQAAGQSLDWETVTGAQLQKGEGYIRVLDDLLQRPAGRR